MSLFWLLLITEMIRHIIYGELFPNFWSLAELLYMIYNTFIMSTLKYRKCLIIRVIKYRNAVIAKMKRITFQVETHKRKTVFFQNCLDNEITKLISDKVISKQIRSWIIRLNIWQSILIKVVG